MEPEFMSDALDDLRDFYSPAPPRVYDVPAGFVQQLVVNGAAMSADLDFLRMFAPEQRLLRGCLTGVAMQHATTPAYVPSEASARAARHLGHVEANKRYLDSSRQVRSRR